MRGEAGRSPQKYVVIIPHDQYLVYKADEVVQTRCTFNPICSAIHSGQI